MVVKVKLEPDDNSAAVDPNKLDLGHTAFFVGRLINDSIIESGENEGFLGLRESHGYVVQHLIESERTITELAARMRVTQQAASKAVAELVELGYLELQTGRDRREKRVRLSKRGWATVEFARRARRRLGARLRRAVGEDEYEHARLVLVRCLKVLGGVAKIRGRRFPQPR